MPRVNPSHPLPSYTDLEPDFQDESDHLIDDLNKEFRCHKRHRKDLQKIRRSIEDHIEKRRLRDMQDLPFDDEDFDFDDGDR